MKVFRDFKRKVVYWWGEWTKDKWIFHTHKAWERSSGIVGHRPTFKITCKMCRPWWWPWKIAMVLRNSNLMISVIDEQKEGKEPAKNYIHRLNYKCPLCDWVTAFLWVDTAEYIREIQKRRGGQTLYYPGIEEWMENKYAAQKLKELGYF